MAQIALSCSHPTTKSRRSFWQLLSVYRGRQTLARLDDAQLLDIGLTRGQARREANRPFWDAPAHWK